LVAAGKVRVNGKLGTLGSLVGENDRVEVDGVPVARALHKTYVVLHKPIGVVTTMSDPQGRRTVRDLLPAGTPRIVPVGRLDYDSSGVLLLTDDGDLAHRLLHPRFGVEKTYRATISGHLLPEELQRLAAGMQLAAFRTHSCRVRVLASRKGQSVIELTMHEGKNRQVRQMLDALGHPVLTLERLRFGPVELGELRPGQSRFLSERELEHLRRIGGNSTLARGTSTR
jgi:pseudouridine synthase